MGTERPVSQGASAAGADPGSEVKVSIITVCRNEERLIEETCRSVAAQVFDDFEWLVIDGASTDGTLEVLERYRGHMSFFVSEPDGGHYEAMNKGLKQARGEYLLFLNGGDSLADPLVLARLFRYETDNRLLAPLKPSLKADIVFGEQVARETGFMPWPVMPLGRRRLGLLYFKMHSLPHQAAFIRRSLFEKIGPYETCYTAMGDYEWFMRAILRWRATYEYVPLVIAVYNYESANVRAVDPHYQGHAERRRAYRKYALNPYIWAADSINALRAGLMSGLMLASRLVLPPALLRRLWLKWNRLAVRLLRSSY